MADFGTMIARIRRELKRLTVDEDEVRDAIISAIQHERDTRYWWTEAMIAFDTVQGQIDYDTFRIDGTATVVEFQNLIDLDYLIVTVGSTRYHMNRRNFEWVDTSRSSTTHQGYPDEWAFGAKFLRLYPDPNVALLVQGKALWDFNTITATSSIGETNDWFTHGEELIRTRAKWDLFMNYYDAPEQASRMEKAHAIAKDSALAESEKKIVGYTAAIPYYSWG